MTNELVVIVNTRSLKVPKIKKISCTKLQLLPEPLTRGLLHPDPCSLCSLSSTEFVETPPPQGNSCVSHWIYIASYHIIPGSKIVFSVSNLPRIALVSYLICNSQEQKRVFPRAVARSIHRTLKHKQPSASKPLFCLRPCNSIIKIFLFIA